MPTYLLIFLFISNNVIASVEQIYPIESKVATSKQKRKSFKKRKKIRELSFKKRINKKKLRKMWKPQKTQFWDLWLPYILGGLFVLTGLSMLVIGLVLGIMWLWIIGIILTIIGGLTIGLWHYFLMEVF